MRDPNRIDYILELLGKGWKAHPDLRFCQLMEILKHYMNVDDCFYIEDDQFAQAIIDYFDLDEDEEESTCKDCIYEDVDDTTDAISNCVCCKRLNDLAKNDYYMKK